MLSFAAFVPHPPIIVPQIGGDNLKYCMKTTEAMEVLAADIETKDIDTVIFISPHTTLSPNYFVISNNDEAAGDFSHLGYPEISYRSRIDFSLAGDIYTRCQKEKIRTEMLHHPGEFSLDHGVLVPYFFLKPELPSSCEIIILGYSNNSRSEHVKFGKVIAKVAEASDKNIALIASGDLSHKTFETGADEVGRKFDRSIIKFISDKQWKEIKEIDEGLREEAGECGYRSLLMLIGSIENKEAKPEVLSYEAPFGVGYMVANFHLGQ